MLLRPTLSIPDHRPARCMIKARAAGSIAIPQNSRKWVRYRRNVLSSNSPVDMGRRKAFIDGGVPRESDGSTGSRSGHRIIGTSSHRKKSGATEKLQVLIRLHISFLRHFT